MSLATKTRATLLTLLDDWSRHEHETALVAPRGLRFERWSYGRLRTTAAGFARELETRDIGLGDRVILWAANGPEWVAAFFGCLLRGAVVVPLDAASPAELPPRVQAQVEARLVLHGRDQVPPEGVSSLVLDNLAARPTPATPVPAPAAVGPDDLVEVVFTSGTTAEPRGVRITHRNVLAALAPIEKEIQKLRPLLWLARPLRLVDPLPLSHLFGQYMGMFVPQVLGAQVLFPHSHGPAQVIETIRRGRISVMAAVPRQLGALRDSVEREARERMGDERFERLFAASAGRGLPRRAWAFRRVHRRFGWRFWAFACGAATLDHETEEFWRRLGFAVVQGYGLTEAASLVAANHPLRPSAGSVGRPLAGLEVKVDEGTGEILVRGDSVSPGYWQGGPLTDREGWLRTGDLAERDASGALRFRGRAKDVIVTAAGQNVHPQDLEAALEAEPEVETSAVVGVEGPHGPEPVAVLLLRDAEADPGDVVRRANARLAPHQRMRRWFVWPGPELPRTRGTEKVQKQAVAEAVRASRGGRPPGRGGSEGLAEAIASITGETPARADPSASLALDLKLDSLGRVELLSALEDRYRVDLDEAAFTEATTLGQIETMLRGKPARTGPPHPYPRWTQRFPATWGRFLLLYAVVLPITRALCWARSEGRDRLRALHGPALFVSNHVTKGDQALILSALPARFRRRLAIAMDGELLRDWRHPPPGSARLRSAGGFALYLLVTVVFNVFSLPKRSGFRRSFAFAGESVDRGYSILVFPEGLRTRDGRLQPFLAGAGILAGGLDVPVVPVAIAGLFEVKARRRWPARPGRVAVRFGEPVRYPPGEDAGRIAADLETRVRALLAG